MVDEKKYGIIERKGRTIVEPKYSTIRESVIRGIYQFTKENGAQREIDLIKWGKPLILYHILKKLILLCLTVVGVFVAVIKIKKRKINAQ